VAILQRSRRGCCLRCVDGVRRRARRTGQDLVADQRDTPGRKMFGGLCLAHAGTRCFGIVGAVRCIASLTPVPVYLRHAERDVLPSPDPRGPSTGRDDPIRPRDASENESSRDLRVRVRPPITIRRDPFAGARSSRLRAPDEARTSGQPRSHPQNGGGPASSGRPRGIHHPRTPSRFTGRGSITSHPCLTQRQSSRCSLATMCSSS
jgi:hypothetical protein